MTNDVLAELKRPFHPSAVEWKPGEIARDQSKALAHPHAGCIAYHNRLDEVCGLGWAVSYVPWGERIVCHLTINGVTRSASGENGEFDNAEAAAFKRACGMFGLGRYLMNIPPVWVEYDASLQRFTERGQARLDGTIVEHYRRTLAEKEMES